MKLELQIKKIIEKNLKKVDDFVREWLLIIIEIFIVMVVIIGVILLCLVLILAIIVVIFLFINIIVIIITIAVFKFVMIINLFLVFRRGRENSDRTFSFGFDHDRVAYYHSNAKVSDAQCKYSICLGEVDLKKLVQKIQVLLNMKSKLKNWCCTCISLFEIHNDLKDCIVISFTYGLNLLQQV